MASLVFYVLFITFSFVAASELHSKDGIMDRLSNGMKIATDFLGSESVALKVAEFVVRAFQTGNKKTQITNKRPYNNINSDNISEPEQVEYNAFTHDEDSDYNVNETQKPMAPLRHVIRLFGLQPNQIGAVAVNALVFVAQLISSFLAGPKRQTGPYRSDELTSWILNKNSRRLQDLIAAAKNTSLPNTIDDLIIEQGSEEEVSCIRLLVCKITPFILRMQKTVFFNIDDSEDGFGRQLRGSAAMYRHLPNADEINTHNDICEQQHRNCNLNE